MPVTAAPAGRAAVPFVVAALSGAAGIWLLIRSARHPSEQVRMASRVSGAMALFFALFLGSFAAMLASS